LKAPKIQSLQIVRQIKFLAKQHLIFTRYYSLK
jgi:hypothetical protein